MKKNIVIVILSVLLTGSLVAVFILSQNKTTRSLCEECVCNEEKCPKLEEINNWNRLELGLFEQTMYESGGNVDIDGFIVDENVDLENMLSGNDDKDKIINDIKKYDLEKGTYILVESGMSSCGGDAPGMVEILVKDDMAILVKNKYKTSPGEVTCMGYITNVYGIYIPMKISRYTIIK